MTAAIALAMGLIALGAGPSAAGAYLLTLGLATIVMVYLIERRRPFERIVLSTTAAMLVAGVAVALAVAGSPAALAEALRHDLICGNDARRKVLQDQSGLDSTIPSETARQYRRGDAAAESGTGCDFGCDDCADQSGRILAT